MSPHLSLQSQCPLPTWHHHHLFWGLCTARDYISPIPYSILLQAGICQRELFTQGLEGGRKSHHFVEVVCRPTGGEMVSTVKCSPPAASRELVFTRRMEVCVVLPRSRPSETPPGVSDTPFQRAVYRAAWTHCRSFSCSHPLGELA